MQPEQQAIAVQNNAVKQLARQYRGFTPALAFRSDEPNINALIKEKGIDEVEATFTLHLVALSRYLNLKAGLQEDQIDFIVEKLTTDYKWFKMADFAILIDRIKSNKYGEFYENFNGNKFFECLQQYEAERDSEIARIRQEESRSHQGGWKIKLPYTIDKDGRIRLVGKEKEKREAEEAKRKAEEEKRRRMEEESRVTMERATQIQAERGCTIQEAYSLAMAQTLK